MATPKGYRDMYVTAGQTRPVEFWCKRQGKAVDLTGATVTVSAQGVNESIGGVGYPTATVADDREDALLIRDAACVVDADERGRVTWTPTDAQTTAPGKYRVQFKVVHADDSIEFFPERLNEVVLYISPAI